MRGRRSRIRCSLRVNLPSGDEVSPPPPQTKILALQHKLQTQSAHAVRAAAEKKLQGLGQIAIRDSKMEVNNQGMQSTRELGAD
jgi:hypothetical protein